MTDASARDTRYARRLAAGLCPYAEGHGAPEPGKKACTRCLQRHREAMQRHTIRRKKLRAQGKRRGRRRANTPPVPT
jgi:hypothetical protein